MAARSIARFRDSLEPGDAGLNTVAETVRQMKRIALNGLSRMFDRDKQLFYSHVRQGVSGIVRGGISPRHTVIALMGLRRVEEMGDVSPLDTRDAFGKLLTKTDWIADIGALGLLVWATAVVRPEQLDEVINRLEVVRALSRFRGAREACTSQLAWFLAGLCHACSVEPAYRSLLRHITSETYQLLTSNQNDSGLFRSYGGRKGLQRWLRSGYGTFADQAYSIYALARLASISENSAASEKALDCALAICELQGARGQWWAKYNAVTGTLASLFPLYTVHQHGIASMALFTLGDLIGADFSPWIHQGIKWIVNNETGAEFLQPDLGVIWRGVDRNASSYLRSIANILSRQGCEYTSHELRVVKECDSWELGWLLYGSAREKYLRPMEAIQRGQIFHAGLTSRTNWTN